MEKWISGKKLYTVLVSFSLNIFSININIHKTIKNINITHPFHSEKKPTPYVLLLVGILSIFTDTKTKGIQIKQ